MQETDYIDLKMDGIDNFKIALMWQTTFRTGIKQNRGRKIAKNAFGKYLQPASTFVIAFILQPALRFLRITIKI